MRGIVIIVMIPLILPVLWGCPPVQAPKMVEPAWMKQDAEPSIDCDPHETLFPRVEHSTFDVVVVPREYLEATASSVGSSSIVFGHDIESFWTPSAGQVLTAETGIRAALAAAAADLQRVVGPGRLEPTREAFLQRQIEQIVPNLKSYDAQCAGVVIKGRRLILWNFIWRDTSTERFLGNSRMCGWVQVNDGGHRYWQIQYDAETGRCLGFESNGYA